MAHTNMRYDSFIDETWFIHIVGLIKAQTRLDMGHSDVRHNSYIYETWISCVRHYLFTFRTCQGTKQTWRDLLIRETLLIWIWYMIHFSVRHHLCTCQSNQGTNQLWDNKVVLCDVNHSHGASLAHSAAYCNTLQHIAIHCNKTSHEL